MWPELNNYAVSVGQPLLAVLFLILALRLLFGRRLGWSMPGRRPAVSNVEAPPARLAAAFQPLQAAAPSGDEKVSNLTAAWIAKGASTLDRPAPAEPPPAEPPPVWTAPAPRTAEPLGHQVSAEELIRWGQQAARAGDRPVAYRLFIRAIEVDPTNESAWLWRAGTCDQTEEALRCLEQVLLINPNNQRALRGLAESQRRLAGL